MKFYTIKVVSTLHGDVSDLWNMLALNFGNIAHFSADLKESRYLSKRITGIGTARHCIMINGGFMKEEITEWVASESLAFQIIDSSIPLQKGSSLSFKFKQINTDKIYILVKGKYRLSRFGFLSPILQPKMKQLINNYLKDIQNAIVK